MLDYKDLPEISCIYKIVNILNPTRVYVGSAKNLKKRVKAHVETLKANSHHNYLLQRAVNKHGLEQFNLHIIDYCPEAKLKDKEQFWLDALEPFYNICKTVDKVETTPEKELERKQKISDSQRGISRKKIVSTEINNVSYHQRDKLYIVQVGILKTNYFVGSFKTLEEAKIIADKYRFASKEEIEAYINSKKKTKRSTYDYVSYKLYKTKKCWYSYYQISRKERVFFGYFDTELEAVRAYNNYITINKINKPILIIKDN